MRIRFVIPLLFLATALLGWALVIRQPKREQQTPIPQEVAQPEEPEPRWQPPPPPPPMEEPQQRQAARVATPRPTSPHPDPVPEVVPETVQPETMAAAEPVANFPEDEEVLRLPPSLENADVAEQRLYYQRLATYHERILESVRAELPAVLAAAQTDEDRQRNASSLAYLEHVTERLALLRGRIQSLSE